MLQLSAETVLAVLRHSRLHPTVNPCTCLEQYGRSSGCGPAPAQWCSRAVPCPTPGSGVFSRMNAGLYRNGQLSGWGTMRVGCDQEG